MSKKKKAPIKEQSGQNKDSHLIDFEEQGKELVRRVIDCCTSISAFPIQAFPNRIKALVLATNKALNFPTEYTASSILYAISVAIGTPYKIIPQSGWEEGGSLWIAVVGKAGAAKSPVLKFILKPLMNLERKANVNYANEVAQYNALSKSEKASAREPAPTRYFVQDVTQEALMVTHSNNLRGVGLKFDELVSFWGNFDRYQGNTEGLFLSGWDGDSNKIDRISRPSIEIEEMYMPIIGGTQPSKLSSLAKGGRDSSGFIPRFLFCFPENIKKGKWNRTNLDPKHIINWEYTIHKLIQSGEGKVQKLQLATNAYVALEAWQHKNADEVDELGEGTLAEMYNKAERQCVRLALILQLLYWASNEDGKEEISLRAVEGAIQIIDYFKLQAKKVCDQIYDSSPVDRLPKNKRDFFNSLPDVFGRSDADRIGIVHGITGGTIKRLLADRSLFEKEGHGKYAKVV